jgi:hypothetical protein
MPKAEGTRGQLVSRGVIGGSDQLPPIKTPTLADMGVSNRLRAERRAGELLRDMPKNVGAVPGKTGIRAQPVLDTTPTLADMGVSNRLRAERRAGELLRDMPKAQGTRGAGDANIGRGTGGSRSQPPVDNTPTLKELNISNTQSSKWQKLAPPLSAPGRALTTTLTTGLLGSLTSSSMANCFRYCSRKPMFL